MILRKRWCELKEMLRKTSRNLSQSNFESRTVTSCSRFKIAQPIVSLNVRLSTAGVSYRIRVNTSIYLLTMAVCAQKSSPQSRTVCRHKRRLRLLTFLLVPAFSSTVQGFLELPGRRQWYSICELGRICYSSCFGFELSWWWWWWCDGDERRMPV